MILNLFHGSTISAIMAKPCSGGISSVIPASFTHLTKAPDFFVKKRGDIVTCEYLMYPFSLFLEWYPVFLLVLLTAYCEG